MPPPRKIAAPPNWIEPCIPTLVGKPPRGAKWQHEVKWDGYRISLVIDAGTVKVRTRRGLNWTDCFPAIAESAAKLDCRNAVIDGEAVVLDAQGRPDFAALQATLAKDGSAAVAYVFDLLFFDGRDVRAFSLAERRKALEALIGKRKGAILLSELVDVDGAEFFRTACAHGLEGIVSKRIDLPYRSGKRGDWLKTKCVQTDTFVIVGYQPDARGRIANLKLATDEDGEFRYAGAVGTGWDEATALALKKLLDALSTQRPSIASLKAKGAVWVRPELRALIAYRGTTGRRGIAGGFVQGIAR